MTNVSILKITGMPTNWFEPKNIKLSILLETFIWPLTCGHPQNHNRLGWKPHKNSLTRIISLCHSPLCYYMLYSFITLPRAFIPYSFYSSWKSHLVSISFLWLCSSFHLSVINTLMLDMSAFNFICMFNHCSIYPSQRK